jgi:hypothetical protein
MYARMKVSLKGVAMDCIVYRMEEKRGEEWSGVG